MTNTNESENYQKVGEVGKDSALKIWERTQFCQGHIRIFLPFKMVWENKFLLYKAKEIYEHTLSIKTYIKSGAVVCTPLISAL